MAENEVVISRVSSSSTAAQQQQQQLTATRPAITLSLPPRTSLENIFAGFSTTASAGGASPGPLSLVSSFFSDYSPGIGSRSFSQLLAGAMSSPAAIGSFGGVSSSIPCSMSDDWSNKEVKGDDTKGGEKCEIVDLGFKQIRPINLAVARSPLFTIPPGLSPSGFLNSPGLFSPGQDLFAMSHQQALAQVTAQAGLSQSLMHMPSVYHPSSLTAPTEEPLKNNPSSTTNEFKNQQLPLVGIDPHKVDIESPEIPSSDNKPQASSQALDKPVDDGYHWRKYGQKQVKGGEYPRSYYKCSHQTCPVKKKVERSVEGQISEITYKGQHNHDLPPPSRRAKDGAETNVNSQSKPKVGRLGAAESLNKSNVTTVAQPEQMKEQVVSQATSAQSDSSDVEEMVDDDSRKNTGNNNDAPNPKRRNIEVGAAKVAPSHKTVTEQRIIVQTRSEVDLLDDGFRWRKYGQKVVKGNPHPRSYYKCTTAGCNVRKHVERASTDVKAVITTYEGKHTHDLPTARNNSYNKTNTNQQQLKPHKVFTEVQHDSHTGMDFGSKQSNPVAVLQLKEEQIRV